MENPRPVLIAAVLALLVFAGLTIAVVVRNGPDPLTILSLLVIGLFAFGIIGALRQPPE